MVCALSSACATAPFFRPAAPSFDQQVVEAGIGPHAAFGATEMGLGSSAWLRAQVVPPGTIKDWGGVELVARGSATDFFDYAGKSRVFTDVLAEGSAGVRGSYAFSPTLLLGAEAMGGYEQRSGPLAERLVLASVGMPVAEAATPDLWVYTDVTLGIAVPLDADRRGPFFGFQEVPLGIAWRALPWLVVVAEGGVSIPLNGGYAAVAAAFRL